MPKHAKPTEGDASVSEDLTQIIDPVEVPIAAPSAESTRAVYDNAISQAAQPADSWTSADMRYLDQPKKSSAAKKFGIFLLVLLILAALVYGAGVFYFSNHTYPNTRMSSADISMKNESQIAQIAQAMVGNYTVSTTGDGAHFAFSMKDAGVSVDGAQVGRLAIAQNSPWEWPFNLTKSFDATEYLMTDLNSGGLEQLVVDEVNKHNEGGADPVNASIVYDSGSKAYIVEPEKPGTKLDPYKVLEAVNQAVSDLSDTAILDESAYIKPALVATDPALQDAAATANKYVAASVHLVLGSDEVDAGTINADQISQWVSVGDDFAVTFNEEPMNNYLKEYGNSLDTIGTERTYTRPDGATFTVGGGLYGWEIDTNALVEEVRNAIMNGEQTTIRIPCISEGATYPGKGKAEWGKYVDLSLSEQHARCYDTDGSLLWESDVITGIPDGKHNTPTGVWVILNRESPATLKGEIQEATGQPEYETKVQYWMPFTYQGHGFHDATWQPGFGGSMYTEGYGSHGCANLPYDAAESLFGIIETGNAVVVHD